MKFFELFSNSDAFWTFEAVGAAERAFWEFGTRSLSKDWRSPKLKALKRGRKGDFVTLLNYYGSVPIVSGKALSVLRPYLPEGTEALPVVCERETFFAINVLRIVRCFDPLKSVFSTYSTGEILNIKKFCARPDVVIDVHVFKVPENRNIVIYSGVVRKAIEQAGLTGRAERELFSTTSVALPTPTPDEGPAKDMPRSTVVGAAKPKSKSKPKSKPKATKSRAAKQRKPSRRK